MTFSLLALLTAILIAIGLLKCTDAETVKADEPRHQETDENPLKRI